MLDVLRFVRGAVSGNDSVLPVLTHFCIYSGRIQGANGRISIDAPVPSLKFNAITPAEKFLKAIDNCGGEPHLNLTEAGRLTIKREGFRAILPTQGIEAFPKAEASKGTRHKLADGLCDAVNLLRPFVATDAERPWASTVYFDPENGVAFAATNAMIAMVKTKPFNHPVQIPVFAIDELLRINAHEGYGEPAQWAVDEHSVTFFWPKQDAWMRSQLIIAEWPTETARRWMSMKEKMVKIPKNLSAEIERLLPFCPDPKYPVIHFDGAMLSTSTGDSEAYVELEQQMGKGAFHADNLRPMLKLADKMVITEKAALFSAENFKGVMSLLRV